MRLIIWGIAKSLETRFLPYVPHVPFLLTCLPLFMCLTCFPFLRPLNVFIFYVPYVPSLFYMLYVPSIN